MRIPRINTFVPKTGKQAKKVVNTTDTFTQLPKSTQVKNETKAKGACGVDLNFSSWGITC